MYDYRELKIYECGECPYRKHNNGGGFCEPWYYCSHPNGHNREIKMLDMRSEGNTDIEYYKFPEWCPLPKPYFGHEEISL